MIVIVTAGLGALSIALLVAVQVRDLAKWIHAWWIHREAWCEVCGHLLRKHTEEYGSAWRSHVMCDTCGGECG